MAFLLLLSSLALVALVGAAVVYGVSRIVGFAVSSIEARASRERIVSVAATARARAAESTRDADSVTV